jgi:hypothetical protein
MAGKPGEIRRRTPLPTTQRATIQLPFVLRGTEPLFQFIMDTSANAEAYAKIYAENSDRMIEALERIEKLLEKALALAAPEPGTKTDG